MQQQKQDIKLDTHKAKGSVLVTVFGATGKQGGSVLCALARDEKYRLRGVAWNADSPKFKELKNRGVEMVRADIVTGEGLDEAFKDAQMVFLVIPKGNEDKEYEYGVKLLDKAKAHGVKVIVFSTSIYTLPNFSQKYIVPQIDAKIKITEYLRNLQKGKAGFENVIFVAPGFYYQNFYENEAFAPKKEGDTYVFRLPQTKTLIACDAYDMGPVVKKVLERVQDYSNKNIILDTEVASPAEFIKTVEKVTGKKARIEEIPLSELKNDPNVRNSEQLCLIFKFMDEYTQFGKDFENLVHARDVNPNLITWEDYLKQNPCENP